MPEVADSLEDFAYEILRSYGDCAIKHKQCAAALNARILK